ncbi:hypothetical protein [Xanthomonas vesicatoria]|uniref:hypothetical protein n=2 Tax=Xanthomonas vesicatoria TaxID=56460 RepID=UPI000731FA57|nr:hypothetical protein [Xanthomonas vesicatoria]KTF31105.1 hypothetical protein LMG919_20105 [Xanthomonas vesicatoria]MCC8559241.1 hypothetical protein [Xanthomonas vesicatoria]MCC8602193.1 hypothetical protein [Xanthomonas vesicatoria]MCC8610789.1 hypothetical protein [Xanthomonas vesicatoria]MCC8674894.1 hypothetical protein [Xanthomonas vesicatoria]
MTPYIKRMERTASTFGLRRSLESLWAYSLHLGYNFELPLEYSHSRKGDPQQLKKYVRDFQLDLLLREILIHAKSSKTATKDLKNWDDLAALHRAVNKLSNATSSPTKDIYLVLHRIGHQQIPFFDRANYDYVGRYWLLYRRPEMDILFQQQFSMTTQEYFLATMAIFVLFMQAPEVDVQKNLAPLGLPVEGLKKILTKISARPEQIRAKLLDNRTYGDSWPYTFNEIQRSPLLQLKMTSPQMLFCHRPGHFVRRMLSGCYFDLVGTKGFDKAFGDASEQLPGEIIAQTFPASQITKPPKYKTSAGVRHGADWIISDRTGHIFVECKSSRIPLQAKISPNPSDLAAGLKRLAEAIGQNYSNIQDATRGISGWDPDGLPIYSLIVTLEDWILFSPASTEALDRLTLIELKMRSIASSILKEVPYAAASIKDLPNLCVALADIGIHKFMSKWMSADRRQYLASSYMEESDLSNADANVIFQRATKSLLDELSDRYRK